MFPYSETDTFELKVDRHDDVAHTEVKVVPTTGPFKIEMDELPQVNSVNISGMTEVSYLPSKDTQFYVNYATATLLFHPAAAGREVTIKYSAIGSVLRASDLNELYGSVQQLQQEVFWMLTGAIASCKIEALEPSAASVRLRGGAYYIYARIPLCISQQVIDFTQGEHQLDPIQKGNYQCFLIALDDAGRIQIITGEQGPRREDARIDFTMTLANIHFNKIFIASVIVKDNGDGEPGGILPIQQSDITDLRQALFAGNRANHMKFYFKVEDRLIKLVDVNTGKFRGIVYDKNRGVYPLEDVVIVSDDDTYRFEGDMRLLLREGNSAKWVYVYLHDGKVTASPTIPSGFEKQPLFNVTLDNALQLFDTGSLQYRTVMISGDAIIVLE